MVDKSAGLNFMFLVGFKQWWTMLIAPLKWYDPHDNHMIESYSPIDHERKFVSRIQHNLHFKVLDMNKNKIIFDSGMIVLNAMVYKGAKNWKWEKKFILWCLLEEEGDQYHDILLNKEEEFWEICLIKLDWKKEEKIYTLSMRWTSLTQKPKQLQKFLQNKWDVELFHGLQTNLSINF